jgi:hypothetical protein
MAGAPGTPGGFLVQTGNRVNLVSWNLSTGATSYTIQRSLDNVTYSNLVTISGSPLATSYTDTAVTSGTQYWYMVQAVNVSGSSQFTAPQSIVPAPTGEISLGQLRLQAQQRADRVNSQFVTTSEWNQYIKQAMFELYDLLVTCYEDYFLATPIQWTADGNTFQYPLPDGVLTFANGINPQQTIVGAPFYKIKGVDLALNNANNSYVTINKFNFIDRNRFVYPNTASTIYGVFNLQYRVLGNVLEFIPTPSAGQQIRMWYVPRMTELLADTDTTDFGISGWIEYVIVRAAKYALDKEESDTTILTQEIAYLKQRIEETASNRDEGQPDKISDTRSGNGNGFGTGGDGSGYNGGTGGWAMLALPHAIFNNCRYSFSGNLVLSTQSYVSYVSVLILFSYFLYLNRSQLSRRIKFAWHRFNLMHSTFFKGVLHIIRSSSEKKMIGIYTGRRITFMANMRTVCYRTFIKFIGKSGRYSKHGFFGSIFDKKLTITSTIKGCSPKPTTGVRFWNVFLFKSFSYVSGLWSGLFSHKQYYNKKGI